MSIVDGNWRTFMARATVLSTMLGVVVFGAVKLAVADPGGPSSPDALTFAGVLRTATGAPFVGATTLTFVFHKAGATASACTTDPSVMVTIPASANGAFSAQIPMDPARCPRSLFDGSTVTYDVLQAGETAPIATGVPVTPVPYARFADQAGVNNDCPAGYAPVSGVGTICGRTLTLGTVPIRDEVVKVGTGATAFWIDRFESSVHDRSGTLRGASDAVYPGLTGSGQWAPPMPPLLALSHSSTLSPPSTNITWLQANEACRAAGKRLPTGDEWLAAASGTPDPSSGAGSCQTAGTARNPGAGTACRSVWGAEDMIGNVREWTSEWYAGAGAASAYINLDVQNWPSGYNDDGTTNVAAFVDRGGSTVAGIPAVAARGGSFNDGARAGIFALDLHLGPTAGVGSVGFRCVIPR